MRSQCSFDTVLVDDGSAASWNRAAIFHPDPNVSVIMAEAMVAVEQGVQPVFVHRQDATGNLLGQYIGDIARALDFIASLL